VRTFRSAVSDKPEGLHDIGSNPLAPAGRTDTADPSFACVFGGGRHFCGTF